MGVRRVAVALFACALVATALAQARPALGRAQHAGDIARIEAPREPGADGLAGMTLEELMQELDTPALSIAVVRDFEIAWAKAYGQADVEAGLRATTSVAVQMRGLKMYVPRKRISVASRSPVDRWMLLLE